MSVGQSFKHRSTRNGLMSGTLNSQAKEDDPSQETVGPAEKTSL